MKILEPGCWREGFVSGELLMWHTLSPKQKGSPTEICAEMDQGVFAVQPMSAFGNCSRDQRLGFTGRQGEGWALLSRHHRHSYLTSGLYSSAGSQLPLASEGFHRNSWIHYPPHESLFYDCSVDSQQRWPFNEHEFRSRSHWWRLRLLWVQWQLKMFSLQWRSQTNWLVSTRQGHLQHRVPQHFSFVEQQAWWWWVVSHCSDWAYRGPSLSCHSDHTNYRKDQAPVTIVTTQTKEDQKITKA